MNPEKLKKEFGTYINDCKLLVHDLELLISDLKFQVHENGKLYYAVDFSEIRGYAIPQTPPPEFILFSDETVDTIELQLLLLANLFFNSIQKFILLPPYAVELNGFIFNLKRNIFNSVLRSVLTVFNEAKRNLRNSDIQQYSEIDPGAIDNEQEKKIFSLFKEYAPTILTYLEPIEDPLSRVYRLEREALTGLKHIREFSLSFDNGTKKRWFDKLLVKSKYRRESPGASDIDAIAISLLIQVNQSFLLNNDNARLFLITRSKHMREILEDEIKSEIWPSDICHIIRHPRSFNLLYRHRDSSLEETTGELENELNLVNQFIQLTEKGLGDLDDTNVEEIYSYLKISKQYWRSSQQLSVSLGDSTKLHLNKDPADNISKAVQNILKLVSGDIDFRELIKERLEDLEQNLERDLDIIGLGLFFETLDEEQQLRWKKYLKYEELHEQYEVFTSPQTIPYRLEFHSPETQKKIDNITEKNRLSWLTAIQFFKENLSIISEYELLLATALLLATLNEWLLAEFYCNKAIELRDDDSEELSPHDGYFFLSICMRKRAPTYNRHQLALSYLEKAICYKRKSLGDDNFVDPRYWAEMGTHILMLNTHFHDREDIPDPEKGLRYFEEIESLIEDDLHFIIRVRNNKLFYLVVTDSFENIDLARKEFEEYRTFVSNMLPEVEWPAYLLDTISWLEWLLYEDLSEDQIDTIKTRLKRALSSLGITDSEYKECTDHLEKVEKGLKE